jgi:hypothetical protein
MPIWCHSTSRKLVLRGSHARRTIYEGALYRPVRAVRLMPRGVAGTTPAVRLRQLRARRNMLAPPETCNRVQIGPGATPQTRTC